MGESRKKEDLSESKTRNGQKLPDELLSYVLGFLPANEQARLTTVSRSFLESHRLDRDVRAKKALLQIDPRFYIPNKPEKDYFYNAFMDYYRLNKIDTDILDDNHELSLFANKDPEVMNIISKYRSLISRYLSGVDPYGFSFILSNFRRYPTEVAARWGQYFLDRLTKEEIQAIARRPNMTLSEELHSEEIGPFQSKREGYYLFCCQNKECYVKLLTDDKFLPLRTGFEEYLEVGTIRIPKEWKDAVEAKLAEEKVDENRQAKDKKDPFGLD